MIKFASDIYSLDFNATEIYVDFFSDNNLTNLEVESSESWVTVSIIESYGLDGVLSMRVDTNRGTYPRSATVTLKAYDVIERREVTASYSVRQTENVVIGSITVIEKTIDGNPTSALTMNCNEHTVTLRAQCQAMGDVELINQANWITIHSQEYAHGIYSCELTIQNNTAAQRTSTVTISGYDLNGNVVSTQILLTQLQNEVRPAIFTVDDQYVGPNSQVIEIPIYTENVASWEVTYMDDWLTEQDSTPTSLTLYIDANYIYENRTGEVDFEITSVDDIVTTYSMKVFQRHAIYQTEIPTWKDAIIPIITIGEKKDDVYYIIYINNNEVYTGHAYYIDQQAPEINLSEIVRNYLEDNTNIEIIDELQNTNYITVDVRTYRTLGEELDLVASVQYYYDYSFTDSHKYVRNAPIRNTIDPRQLLPISGFNHTGEINTLSLEYADGQEQYEVETPGIWQRFTTMPLTDYMIVRFGPTEDITYKVKHTCAEYVIYYLNPFGGWDSLLIEGKTVKNIAYDINTTRNDYNNTTIDFGKSHYLKDITTTYKLNTGFITDEQSKRMPYLLQTTKAYLHDFTNDKIIPVLIKNSNTDIKTYRNQNRNMYTYTIEVEESQTKFSK